MMISQCSRPYGDRGTMRYWSMLKAKNPHEFRVHRCQFLQAAIGTDRLIPSKRIVVRKLLDVFCHPRNTHDGKNFRFKYSQTEMTEIYEESEEFAGTGCAGRFKVETEEFAGTGCAGRFKLVVWMGRRGASDLLKSSNRGAIPRV